MTMHCVVETSHRSTRQQLTYLLDSVLTELGTYDSLGTYLGIVTARLVSASLFR